MSEVTLPTLRAYLERLPRGLASYPEAMVKASVIRSALEALPPMQPIATGDASFDRWLKSPPPVNEWVPQVYHSAMLAAVYDTFFAEDGGVPGYERWVLARNRSLLKGPIYRTLFLVLRPGAFLLGVPKRWQAFRRGTTIEVQESGDRWCRVRLSYPAHLMERLTLVGLRMAMQAATEAAGAVDVLVKVDERSPSECFFEVSWNESTESR